MLDDGESVAVGNEYVSKGKWKGRYVDEDTFEIYHNGKWQQAESIDFEFADKYGNGGDVAADRKYSAMKAGRRIGKKVSKIAMSDGSKFKRRNMNQYGQAGGGEYYESRRNRTDKRKTL